MTDSIQARLDQLKKKIRTIPDFPKAGIEFRDITITKVPKKRLTRMLQT